MKPKKESVSIVIRDKDGKFLTVRRAKDPNDELTSLWGLPAATLRNGETEEAACERIGQQKLGVRVKVGSKIGESTQPRDKYIIHLTDYEATITEGRPTVHQLDNSVSQYMGFRFTDDPTILFEAARKGSLCTQIFLNSIGANWKVK